MSPDVKAGKAGKPAVPVKPFPFPPDELLEKGLATLGFPSGDEPAFICGIRVRTVSAILPLVNRYMKELELFNSVFDLVGAETRSDLVVRHILDSLAPWKEIAALLEGKNTPQIADAGSGAGFPGIPLSIIFPEVQFTLIERMSRRCTFLENCVAVLKLTNVNVLNSELEKAPAGVFDVTVFRAFRPLDPPMAKTLLACIKTDGVLAAYKARKDKIEEEMAGIEKEIRGWKIIPLSVPFLEFEERNLVVISGSCNQLTS